MPYPKPHFPLRTAGKTRPTLELDTGRPALRPLKMQFPKLGALGATFTIMRACQFASLIAAIGLCANFISEIAEAERNSPPELIGALTVVSLYPVSLIEEAANEVPGRHLGHLRRHHLHPLLRQHAAPPLHRHP